MSVIELDRKEIPAFVRFDRIPVEDIAASRAEGRYIAKDVDMAIITPPYSKDEFHKTVPDWIRDLDKGQQDGRIPAEWVRRYKEQYQAWKEGKEIPLEGTPIRGWALLSPAQQEMLIQFKVMTVESLAQMNEEGCRRYGMGGIELKQKAQAWLAQAKDKGPLAAENANLKQQVSQLEANLATLSEKMDALQKSLGEKPQSKK